MRLVFGCLVVLLLAAGCTARAEDPGYTVLLETQPSPMQSGRLNTVTVRVKDRADRPVTGAKVTVKAEHKGMAHGGGTFSTDEGEPGVYSGGLIPPMAGKYGFIVNVENALGKVEKSLDFDVR